jgi:hypothetical protein
LTMKLASLIARKTGSSVARGRPDFGRSPAPI